MAERQMAARAMAESESQLGELAIFHLLVRLTYLFAAIVFVLLILVTAPYGRHARVNWGPRMNARVGWMLMESIAPLVCSIAFFRGAHSRDISPLLLYSMFTAHYLQRSIVYPLRMRPGKCSREMPVVLVGFACLYNTLNGYLQGRWLSHFGSYPNDWKSEGCFLAGVAIFLGGMSVNISSDNILRNLRKNPSSEYKIPQGGLFKSVSCPNYFGEIVEWCGWAIATWSQSGLAFAVFTFANLVPRAISHHRWYKSKFEDYPKTRCAVIPHLL